MHTVHAHGAAFEILFLTLQTLVVLFLWLHDWVPLGRLSNLDAIRTEDTLTHRIFVSLLGGLPAGIGLFFSAKYAGVSYPPWLNTYLLVTYAIFLFGLLRAWWLPYLFVPDPARAARYQVIFKGTHAFLPVRNGMVPDTLHTAFHLAVAATLVMTWIR